MGRRIAMATGSVVVSAATGVVTNILSSSWTLTWWLALSVLVVLGVGLQLLVGAKPSASASGAGAVAVAGSTKRTIRTTVQGQQSNGTPSGDISASGPGAIAVGGDTDGEISTNVS